MSPTERVAVSVGAVVDVVAGEAACDDLVADDVGPHVVALDQALDEHRAAEVGSTDDAVEGETHGRGAGAADRLDHGSSTGEEVGDLLPAELVRLAGTLRPCAASHA